MKQMVKSSKAQVCGASACLPDGLFNIALVIRGEVRKQVDISY